MKSTKMAMTICTTFLVGCATVQPETNESKEQLKSAIVRQDWSTVSTYFETHGTLKYSKYEIELAPQCWRSADDVKDELERQSKNFEADMRLCFNPANIGTTGRANCMRHLRAVADLCERRGKTAVCTDERCHAKDFALLPERLHAKFSAEYMRAVELDHRDDHAAATPAAGVVDKSNERYEDSQNTSCAWYYFLPEVKGVAMNDDLAAIIAKKAGVTAKAILEAISEGQRWTDYAFTDVHVRRNPPPMPKIFYGSLNTTGLTPDQLERNFGKAARNDMSLGMIPNRVQVRFIGLKTKPPCGQLAIKYSKAYENHGVLFIEHPTFFPSMRVH